MTMWKSGEFDQHEQVCCFSDTATGLRAIVAVHSTALGPAVGGTRFLPYADDELALHDALRLSRAMSYKSALADLPFGGGKAVLIGDPERLKSPALLHAYAGFLNRIGSSFATGEDVGISLEDCEIMREVSPFVGGTTSAGAGDPSAHTAAGVLHGLRAALRQRLDRQDFAGVHIAVQGLGAVGRRLCELLHAEGARLTVADVRPERVGACVRELGAEAAPVEAIHAVAADIFAPCALGGVVNRETIDAIQAKAVAGAANNQLASPDMGEALFRRGVLFAPDYVINAGGVIGSLEEMAQVPGRVMDIKEPLDIRLAGIERRLGDIFALSAREDRPPEQIALRMARELIGR